MIFLYWYYYSQIISFSHLFIILFIFSYLFPLCLFIIYYPWPYWKHIILSSSRCRNICDGLAFRFVSKSLGTTEISETFSIIFRFIFFCIISSSFEGLIVSRNRVYVFIIIGCCSPVIVSLVLFYPVRWLLLIKRIFA